MYKKPMTKIQFMAAAAGRRKKRAVVVLELSKKGSGEVIISGQPKLYVAVNLDVLGRGRIKFVTEQPTKSRKVKSLDGRCCIMGSAGLEGNHIIRPPKPRQDDAKKRP